MNRTSTNANKFTFRSSNQSPTPPPVHNRLDRKIFCVSDVFTRDTIRMFVNGGGGGGLKYKFIGLTSLMDEPLFAFKTTVLYSYVWTWETGFSLILVIPLTRGGYKSNIRNILDKKISQRSSHKLLLENVAHILYCRNYYKMSPIFVLQELLQNVAHICIAGDPDDLVTTNIKSCDSLTPWHDVSKLRLLNLLYDVTPMQLMSMVITDITDFGLVPMTSVPVVIRVKNSDS